MKTLNKLLIALNFIFLVGCEQPSANYYADSTNSTPSSTISTPKIDTSKKIKIYFSKTKGAKSGGVDEKIISDIKSAKYSIYLAMYEFTNDDIEQALVNAYDKGVDVEVVTDDKQHQNVDVNLYDELEQEGIRVEDDEGFGKGLMHNKILVIDKAISWSGSANFTNASFYGNWENFVRCTDADVVSKYREQIDELLNQEELAGALKKDHLSLYFSPEDKFKSSKLLSLIDSAKSSINFMVFLLNDKDIKDALIRAKNRGVDIHGIFDNKQTSFQSRYTQYNNLKDANIDVKKVGDSWHKLHNKVMIIDKHIVVTGSYNFSYSSEDKNNENSLVIDNKNIAKQYTDKFEEVYQKATN